LIYINTPFIFQALTNAIRNAGFLESVEITFQTEKDEITVKSNHLASRIMDNIFFKIFLFLSFMWVFVLPFIYFYKKKFGHSILKSRWDMSISEANWYQLHAQEIIIMCRNKVISKGKPSKLSVIPPLQITPQMPIIPSAPSV
jgi:hypothetical protein